MDKLGLLDYFNVLLDDIYINLLRADTNSALKKVHEGLQTITDETEKTNEQ